MNKLEDIINQNDIDIFDEEELEYIEELYDDLEMQMKELNKKQEETEKDIIVVDDFQYLMANEFMRRCDEKGYDKFTEMAKNVWSLVKYVETLPAHKRVYFLSHIDQDERGNEKCIRAIRKR